MEKKIREYMESQGIRQVQTMILTHFDKRSCGRRGSYFTGHSRGTGVGTGLCGQRETVSGNMRTRRKMPREVRAVTAEETFSFAGATVTVYPSALTLEDILDSGEKEYDNDLSLAVRLVDEDNTFWFLGDAKVLRIRELLDTEVLDWRLPGAEAPHRQMQWRDAASSGDSEAGQRGDLLFGKNPAGGGDTAGAGAIGHSGVGDCGWECDAVARRKPCPMRQGR